MTELKINLDNLGKNVGLIKKKVSVNAYKATHTVKIGLYALCRYVEMD